MKLNGKIYGITKDILTGQNLLTIAYDGVLGEEVNELTEKKITVEIKPYKEKRSNNANKYMWELCDQIGKKIQMPKEEVYRNAIRDVGWFRDFTLTQETVDTFKYVWSNQGTGWVTEQVDYAEDGEQVIIRAYYGSSTYTKERMSRLIDWLSEEAEQLGITLISDREKSLLIDNWKGVQICRKKDLS